MDSRIKINKDEAKIEVVIKAFYDAKKQKMLLLWIILFSFCGVAIVFHFFGSYDSATKLFFAVYVSFWLFFEFKVVYAYRWRKYGEERIIINNNELLLIKAIGKREITQRFKMEEIKKIDFYKDANAGFIKSMNASYWNINKYHLALNLEKSVIPFALDIISKDAKGIINELRKHS